MGTPRAEPTMWLGTDAASTKIRAAMRLDGVRSLHLAAYRQDSPSVGRPAVAVEIVDAEAQIRGFLEAIEPMMGSSMVTLEKVQVLRYGHDVT